MKVKFDIGRLSDDWRRQSRDNLDRLELVDSILNKIQNSSGFDLPFMPTKEMFVDIHQFSKTFEFTKKEMSVLNRIDNYLMIDDIII